MQGFPRRAALGLRCCLPLLGAHHCHKCADGRFLYSCKTAIFGHIQRSIGNVVALKVDNTQRKTIFPIIEQFVSVRDNMLYTDGNKIYAALNEKNGYKHLACNHNEGRYSDCCGTHTNGIEGFWSHFKRMIDTVNHIVICYSYIYNIEKMSKNSNGNQSYLLDAQKKRPPNRMVSTYASVNMCIIAKIL